MPSKIVITGGAGVGKTTLLSAFAAEGYTVVPEVSRAIIRRRVEQGLPPRPDAGEFAAAILRADMERYQNVEPASDPIFFDRGILDALCMLCNENSFSETAAQQIVSDFPYFPLVFFLPPWEQIYTTDAERDQEFEDVVRVHQLLWDWYTKWGYDSVEVPRASVDERCQFIMQCIEEHQKSD